MRAIIFSKFYHLFAVKIHADQDLENISFVGNLHSTVLMNTKTYHEKPSLVLCGTIPSSSAFADCLDNTLLEITIYPQEISQFLAVYLSIP